MTFAQTKVQEEQQQQQQQQCSDLRQCKGRGADPAFLTHHNTNAPAVHHLLAFFTAQHTTAARHKGLNTSGRTSAPQNPRQDEWSSPCFILLRTSHIVLTHPSHFQLLHFILRLRQYFARFASFKTDLFFISSKLSVSCHQAFPPLVKFLPSLHLLHCLLSPPPLPPPHSSSFCHSRSYFLCRRAGFSLVPQQDNPSTYNLFSGVAAECEPRPLKRTTPALPQNTLTASLPLGNTQELTLLHACFGGYK